jgi:hypothetical protein
VDGQALARPHARADQVARRGAVEVHDVEAVEHRQVRRLVGLLRELLEERAA